MLVRYVLCYYSNRSGVRDKAESFWSVFRVGFGALFRLADKLAQGQDNNKFDAAVAAAGCLGLMLGTRVEGQALRLQQGGTKTFRADHT